MRTISKSICCILFVALVSMSDWAKADELVRFNADEVSAMGTIIRSYQQGQDVVCCNVPYSRSFFVMYDEGTSMLYALYVDMDTVADFEIYDDTVYFCGKKKSTIGAQYTVKFRQGSFGGHCLYRNYNEIKDFGIDHDRDHHNIPLTKILQLPEVAMGDRKDMRVETLCYSLSDETEE